MNIRKIIIFMLSFAMIVLISACNNKEYIDVNDINIEFMLPSDDNADGVKIAITNHCKFSIALLPNNYIDEVFQLTLPDGALVIPSEQQVILDDEINVKSDVTLEEFIENIKNSDLSFSFLPDTADNSSEQVVIIKLNSCFN